MRYASLCAIVKDENLNLKEWLAYHFAIGFEHAIIYDNNSSVPVSDFLRGYVESGLVSVIDFPLRENQQLSAYFHCLRERRKDTFWLAFIDVDEFLVPLQHTDIRDFLDDYTDYGGVGVHWKMFGSNGHINRPAGGVIASYTESLGLNRHVKSIVRPAAATHPLSPHHFAYKDDYYCVNEDKFLIHAPVSYPVAGKIQLNHYYYKSQRDFEDKVARGHVTRLKNNAQRDISKFYAHLSAPVSADAAILKFQKLTQAFEKLPPAALAAVVAGNMGDGPVAEIRKFGEAIAAADLAGARSILRRLKRCHNTFEVLIMEAGLFVLEGESKKSLELLCDLARKYGADPTRLGQVYEQLRQYYKAFGKPETAASVREWMAEVQVARQPVCNGAEIKLADYKQ